MLQFDLLNEFNVLRLFRKTEACMRSIILMIDDRKNVRFATGERI